MLVRSNPLTMVTNVLLSAIYYFLIFFISYTFMNKLLAIQSFQTNLLKTGLYSSSTTEYLSYLVLAGELFVLIALLFFRKLGERLLLAMLTVFTIYICFLQFTGRYEVCGCGGVLNGLAFKYHLVINVVLVFFALLLVQANSKNNSHEN